MSIVILIKLIVIYLKELDKKFRCRKHLQANCSMLSDVLRMIPKQVIMQRQAQFG